MLRVPLLRRHSPGVTLPRAQAPGLPRAMALALMLPLLWSADAAAQVPGRLDDVRGWFTRMQTAAQQANFQGTLVFNAGGTMTSSRVGHYSVGAQTYETLEALDGHQQRMLRHNDTVHTLWPQTRLAVIEKRETLAGWSTTPQPLDPLALENYKMRQEGLARVAGREAVVFLLEPNDALRYAQRLWADRDTGLMLRADVLRASTATGERTQVLESTAFSSVEIGVKAQPEAVMQAMQRLEGYRVLRPRQRRTTLDAEGWQVTRPVPGFQPVGCLHRGMETAGGDDPVLQAVFSDGLTHVSVFVEPYRSSLHKAESGAQQGATSSLTQRVGEHWFTAVGDVPAATLKRFVSALDRKTP
jgi:sigma-E factor negative regulatory protein RseB